MRRFRIHHVDDEARLFVYVQSAWSFVQASYVRDLLRVERGGDWIIIDGDSGRVVSDTRPGWPDVDAARARLESGVLADECSVHACAPAENEAPAQRTIAAPGRGRRRAVEEIPE